MGSGWPEVTAWLFARKSQSRSHRRNVLLYGIDKLVNNSVGVVVAFNGGESDASALHASVRYGLLEMPGEAALCAPKPHAIVKALLAA